MNIQDKTKKELISELQELHQENDSLKKNYEDIAKFKNVESDLLASEIRYRSLFESAKDGILILDAETGKIVDVNPYLINLLGFSHDQFIKKSIWEIGIFKDIIANQDKFIELRESGYVRYSDLPLETKDGRKINVEFVSNVYLADNKKVIQCNIRDITARIKIEKELINAKEKAEESDRLKSAFLANMSHEIRTPMNGILGFAELLKKPDLKGEKQQEYIRIIAKSGLRMLNIINNIIDISKIEAGLMEIYKKESNINEQLEYVYTFFKPEIERKELQLILSKKLPLKEAIINTDPEKIYAILTNLVKNAIKFTNKGLIEFGCILKKDTEPVEVEFFVKDTGIGIPKNMQEAIFERFIQADISDIHALQGSGLGLTISKAYVELLGGRMWVKSEEENLQAGKAGGSTLYFTIPYSIKPEDIPVNTAVVEKDETKDNTQNLKILIAEDDEASKILLSIELEEFGREILIAKNGFEAVELCRNNPDTDLILMDIQMPGMNGYEATRQIRKFNHDVVVIAQTAFAQYGDREKSIDAGCNDYISKPINKAELQTLMHKTFNVLH